ncbi:MAG: PRC-barrel domain-containing protein [Acidobacteria bacterium]|nr:PRC-barrel domain-containing protein [Acidobacteriota bacterium]
MPRYSTLGDYRFATADDAADIRGSKVYGLNDEKLGEIDDVIFDEATGGIIYVVIDTGGWLSSKKFLIPPQTLRTSLTHENDFRIDLGKSQIETFPPYDSKAVSTEAQWADYDRRYRSNWSTGPVMHREGTDRNVTPTTQQQVHAGSGAIPSAAEEDPGTPVTPVRTEAEMDISAAGPSLRWTTFEDKLRQRREEVLESSINHAKRAGAGDRRRAG